MFDRDICQSCRARHPADCARIKAAESGDAHHDGDACDCDCHAARDPVDKADSSLRYHDARKGQRPPWHMRVAYLRGTYGKDAEAILRGAKARAEKDAE